MNDREAEAARRRKEQMQAQEAEQRRALEERGRQMRQAEADSLKARYRQNFLGTDAEFEAAWPAMAAKIAEERARRSVNPL
jgi:hypothetical protein